LISVRSEVQIFPGPPAFARVSEAKAGDCCARASVRQASLSLRLESAAEQGAIAQLGERLLCKQEVVGSIPSGSTSRVVRIAPGHRSARPEVIISPRRHRKIRRGGLSDIVKKRSLRAAGGMQIPCGAQSPASKRNAHREWKHSPVNMALRCLSSCCLTAEDVGTISKQAGLSNQCRPRRVAWALIMRAIKCLKGIRWMPWR
jgi:hypothetical protein